MTQEHLRPARSSRGFTNFPAIPSQYGGEVRAYESSAASGPHVWLRVVCPADLNSPDGPTIDAVAHLTAEDAWRLMEQLRSLVENHYQGDAVPDWAQS